MSTVYDPQRLSPLATVLRAQTEGLDGQTQAKLQTRIPPTQSARKTAGAVSICRPRPCSGGGAATSDRHFHEPIRPRGVGPQNDEARREPKGRGSAQITSVRNVCGAICARSTEATRVGRVWKIVDSAPFHLPIYSRNQIVPVWLRADEASKAGEYLSAVGRFLPTGDARILKPFVGDGVRDVSGALHPFETGPNNLYRLDSTGELVGPRNLQDPRMRACHGGV